MTVLTHPETGQEFDAPERSVATWQRSGWQLKNPPPGQQAPAGGKTAAVSAGKPESAGE